MRVKTYLLALFLCLLFVSNVSAAFPDSYTQLVYKANSTHDVDVYSIEVPAQDVAFQLKFKDTTIPAGSQTILVNASLGVYWPEGGGLTNNDARLERVDAQDWQETLNAAGWIAQALTDQDNGQTWNSTADNAWGYINVTAMVLAMRAASESNVTIRVQDLDFLTTPANVVDAAGLWVGQLLGGFNKAEDSDNALGTGNYPILEVWIKSNNTPNVSLNSPLNASWNKTSDRNISFEFTPFDGDGDNFDYCNLTLWHANTTSLNSSVQNFSDIANASSNFFHYVFAADGSYLWNVECTDVNGNLNRSSVNYTVHVDATLPTDFTFVSPTPANATWVLQNYFDWNVTFTETNPTDCEVEINGSNITGSVTTGPNPYCELNRTSQADGQYNVRGWQNDSASNWNVSDWRYIYIDDTPPQYSSRTENVTNSSEYDPNTATQFSIDWVDAHAGLDTIVFNLAGSNHTVAGAGTYNYYADILDAGNYSNYWCANDTLDQWSCTAGETFEIKFNKTGLKMERALFAAVPVNTTSVGFKTIGSQSFEVTNTSNSSVVCTFTGFSANSITGEWQLRLDAVEADSHQIALNNNFRNGMLFSINENLAAGNYTYSLRHRRTAGGGAGTLSTRNVTCVLVFALTQEGNAVPFYYANTAANYTDSQTFVNMTTKQAVIPEESDYLAFWGLDLSANDTCTPEVKGFLGSNFTLGRQRRLADSADEGVAGMFTGFYDQYSATVHLGLQWKASTDCNVSTVGSHIVAFGLRNGSYVVEANFTDNDTLTSSAATYEVIYNATLELDSKYFNVFAGGSCGVNVSDAGAIGSFVFRFNGVEWAPDIKRTMDAAADRAAVMGCWYSVNETQDFYAEGLIKVSAGSQSLNNCTFALVAGEVVGFLSAGIWEQPIAYSVIGGSYEFIRSHDYQSGGDTFSINCSFYANESADVLDLGWVFDANQNSNNTFGAIDTSAVPDGYYFPYCELNDTNGFMTKQNLSGEEIYIDNTPPSDVAFLAPTPADATIINDTYKWVYVNASFVELNEDSCLLDWNGTNESMTLVPNATGGYCYKNKTVSAYGNYTFAVYVNDSAGNWNWSGERSVYAELCRTLTANYTMVGTAAKASGNCFVIGAPGLELDCDDNAIYIAGSGTGVAVNGHDQFVVENCLIYPTGATAKGMLMQNSNNSRVFNCTAYGGKTGFSFVNTSYLNISYSNGTNADTRSFSFKDSVHLLVQNNTGTGISAGDASAANYRVNNCNNSVFLNDYAVISNNKLVFHFLDSYFIDVLFLNMSGDTGGAYLFNFEDSNVTFVDSNLAGHGNPYFNSGAAVYFVNASPDSSTFAGGSNGNATIKWYTAVRVVDGAVAVQGASVNVTDVNDSAVFDNVTNASGWTSVYNVTEYFQNSTSIYNRTPHTFNASKSCYFTNSTVWPVTTNTYLSLNISAPPLNVTAYTTDCLNSAQTSFDQGECARMAANVTGCSVSNVFLKGTDKNGIVRFNFTGAQLEDNVDYDLYYYDANTSFPGSWTLTASVYNTTDSVEDNATFTITGGGAALSSASAVASIIETNAAGYVIGTCRDADNHFATSEAQLFLYYQNNTLWLDNSSMTTIATGRFNFSQQFYDAGAYWGVVNCTSGGDYAESNAFHVQVSPSWLVDIRDWTNETNETTWWIERRCG